MLEQPCVSICDDDGDGADVDVNVDVDVDAVADVSESVKVHPT
jgi:hypothetical protein